MAATVDLGILITFKNNITRPFRKLDKNLEKTGKSAQKTANRLRAIQVVLASIVIGKAAQVAGKVFEIASAFENVQKQLIIFNSSVSDARMEMEGLIDAFANTAFGVLDVTKALVRMKAAGVDQATFAVKALADAVSAFGGGTDEINRASIAIQQIAGKGVVSMEEMRQQLGEAIPFAMRVLAKSTNRSMGQLIFDIERGRLSAQEFNETFFKGLDEAFGGAAEIPGLAVSAAKFKKAFTNAIVGIFDDTNIGEQLGLILESLANKATKFFEKIDQGTVDSFIDSLQKTLTILENLAIAVGKVATVIGPMLKAMLNLATVLSGHAADHPFGVIGLFLFGKMGLSALRAALPLVFAVAKRAMLAFLGPIGAIIAGAGLIDMIFFGSKGAKAVKDSILTLFDETKEKFSGMMGTFERFKGFSKVFGLQDRLKTSTRGLSGAFNRLRAKLSGAAKETVEAGGGITDLGKKADVVKKQKSDLADAIAGMNDELANVPRAAINAAAGIVKLQETVQARIAGAEGKSFDAMIQRLNTQLRKLKTDVQELNEVDPTFIAEFNKNAGAAAGAIEKLRSILIGKEMDKISRTTDTVLQRTEKWANSLTDSKLDGALRNISLKYDKLNSDMERQLELWRAFKEPTDQQLAAIERLTEAQAKLAETRDIAVAKAKKQADTLFNMTVTFTSGLINIVEGGLGNAIEGLVTGTRTLKEAMFDMFSSITAAAAQFIAKLLVIKALQTASRFLDPTGTTAAAIGGAMGGFAKGGAFSGAITPFAKGGVIGGPTLFGLAGEKGKEAILPLSNVGGKLGINANVGGGGDSFNISITALDSKSVAQLFAENADSIVGPLQRANKLRRGV